MSALLGDRLDQGQPGPAEKLLLPPAQPLVGNFHIVIEFKGDEQAKADQRVELSLDIVQFSLEGTSTPVRSRSAGLPD